MDVALINGSPIAYRHRPGLGRTIVFANSLGSDQSIWDKVIDALPRGYGFLTYDLRGHGQSGGLADDIEGLADDVSQLIDLLGLTDVLYCGVSIGGMIGQVLAARRADVIKGAVLCCTASQIGSSEKWNTRIEAVQDKGTEGIADMIVGTWFGPAYAAQSDRIALHHMMVSRADNGGYIAACRAIRDADLSDHAKAITVPTLCIAGQHDQSVPPKAVEGLAATIPGAQLHLIEDIGHLPGLEVPKLLADLIAEFDPRDVDTATVGVATRRAVLGDAHVDRAIANISPLDAAFQALITTGAWGQVWSDPSITARERSMLTVALLAAEGNFEELAMHIRATARTGASADDIAAALQHVAIYAGVPRANHALKIAKDTFQDMADND